MIERAGTILADNAASPPCGDPSHRFLSESIRRWTRLLCLPGESNLHTSLVHELSEYTGLPPAAVDERMRQGETDLADHWNRLVTDPTSVDQLVAFYNADLTEAYELASWHAGDKGAFPLKYLGALDFAARRRLRNVLDFGSGIGSGTIVFAHEGFSVTYADIATPLLDLTSFRLAQRGLNAHRINLLETTPERGTYDLICAFDVLEHIPNQRAAIQRLRSYLRPGGWLIANLFPEASIQQNIPLHVSNAGDIHRFMTTSGMWANWHATREFYPFRSDGIALQKTWWAPLLNRVRRWWYDVSARPRTGGEN